MSTELKVYKFDLKDAAKQMGYLVESITFSDAQISSLKTEVWNDFLIVRQ
jgi:hypothetical protein